MDFLTRAIHMWIIVVSLPQSLKAAGTVYDAKKDKGTFIFCLDRGFPMQFADPFDPAAASSENFLLMEWIKKGKNNASDSRLFYLEKGTDSYKKVIKDMRFSTFQFWGFQVNKVRFREEGTYKASILSSEESENLAVSIDVTVATAPSLWTDKLQIKVDKSNGKKKLVCGQFNDLGIPPIDVAIMSNNGTVLNATIADGYLTVEIDPTMDTGKFYCGIRDPSPAKGCIRDLDIPRWDSSLRIGKATSSSADSHSIIFAVIGVIIGLIIFVVIILIIIKRRRSRKNETSTCDFDPKLEETRAMGVHQYDETDEGSYKPPVSCPPYLPSKESNTSPYMVTGLDRYASTATKRSPQQEPIYKEPLVNKDDSTTLDSRKSWAGGEGMRQQQQLPPVAKKRNKHFNRSSDGLNLVDKGREDRGDTGSEHAGTLV